MMENELAEMLLGAAAIGVLPNTVVALWDLLRRAKLVKRCC
jgi:hypothetical protein